MENLEKLSDTENHEKLVSLLMMIPVDSLALITMIWASHPKFIKTGGLDGYLLFKIFGLLLTKITKKYMYKFLMMVHHCITTVNHSIGTFINHVDSWGGLTKWPFFTKAIFCKSDHEGGRGSKYPKIWPRGLWMTPYKNVHL